MQCLTCHLWGQLGTIVTDGPFRAQLFQNYHFWCACTPVPAPASAACSLPVTSALKDRPVTSALRILIYPIILFARGAAIALFYPLLKRLGTGCGARSAPWPRNGRAITCRTQ